MTCSDEVYENCEACQDATGGICKEHQEPECTCYETFGGHQPGCAFHGKPATKPGSLEEVIIRARGGLPPTDRKGFA